MNNLFIGQEYIERTSFSEADVNAFAELSGDNNPIHIDDTVAKNSRFGARIVHGIFVASFISKIIGTKLPGKGSVYLEQNLLFKAPVYIDEEVCICVKILEINNKVITLETNVYDKDERCLLEGKSKVLYEK